MTRAVEHTNTPQRAPHRHSEDPSGQIKGVRREEEALGEHTTRCKVLLTL